MRAFYDFPAKLLAKSRAMRCLNISGRDIKSNRGFIKLVDIRVADCRIVKAKRSGELKRVTYCKLREQDENKN